MRPSVGLSMPVIIRARVDLPLPLWPTSAVTAPLRSTKLVSATATVRSTLSPRRFSNTFVTLSTVSTMSRSRAWADSSAVLTNSGPTNRRVRSGSSMPSAPPRRCSAATWQATSPDSIGSSSGYSVRQRSIFSGQRGAKLQPSDTRLRSGGRPGM